MYLDIAFSHCVYFQLPCNLKNQGIMSDEDSSSIQNTLQSQPRREPKIILQRAENLFAALRDSLVSVFMFVPLEQIAITLCFMLGCPCIIFSFTLFSFQFDTLTILYIYNLGSFISLYMFRTDRSIIRRSNAFIAQAASGTVPLVVVCLGRPLVLD
jgi:hypothetical protein